MNIDNKLNETTIKPTTSKTTSKWWINEIKNTNEKIKKKNIINRRGDTQKNILRHQQFTEYVIGVIAVGSINMHLYICLSHRSLSLSCLFNKIIYCYIRCHLILLPIFLNYSKLITFRLRTVYTKTIRNVIKAITSSTLHSLIVRFFSSIFIRLTLQKVSFELATFDTILVQRLIKMNSMSWIQYEMFRKAFAGPINFKTLFTRTLNTK